MKEKRATFAGIARLIAGPDAPVWLAEHLESWSPSLRVDFGTHHMQPTRADMRKRIVQIKDAANLLRASLADVPTREFLELEGKIKIENFGGLDHGLRMIALRADLASSSISVKGGAGRALPKEPISPKVYCAILIEEVWMHFHGRYPGSRNSSASAAATGFWQLSGAKDSGWGNRLNGWRMPFETARKTSAKSIRDEYRRHIHLNAAHGRNSSVLGT